MMKLKAKCKDGDLDLFFKVTEANKEKKFVITISPHYYLYYFHINTSDSYDDTQGQVQRWVTFTYFSRSLANKGKNTSDPYDKTQGQVHIFIKVADADTSWFRQFVSL